MSPELRYPDFLGIGVQKAGTTWLDRNLRCHPGLWLPPVKEVNYFNELYLQEGRAWIAPDRKAKGAGVFKRHVEGVPKQEWDYRLLAGVADFIAGPISDDWYGRIFASAGPDQVCGEISPSYGRLSEEGVRHALKLSPELRVLMSMRDPIERAWSHIRKTIQRARKGTSVSHARLARNPRILEQCDYPATIARWRKYVPEQRFLVVFLEDVVADPNAVIEKICAFLGVPFRNAWFAEAKDPVLVGGREEIPPDVLEILKAQLRPVYERMSVLYPQIGEGWGSRFYGPSP